MAAVPLNSASRFAALAVGAALLSTTTPAFAADAPTISAPPVVEEKKTDIVISGGAAFTTDYVYRGISQTDQETAVQAYIEASYDIFYIGMWGSNLDFGSNAAGQTIADIEVDLYAGIKPKWGIAEFDIGAIYYVYPYARDGGGEFNFFEGKLAVSVPVHELITLGASVNASPDFFGATGTAVYLEANAALNLPYGFGISGALGHQWIEQNAAAGIPDYLTWNIGATYTFRDTLAFDLRYHGTDINNCGLCGDRIVGTISADFSTE